MSKSLEALKEVKKYYPFKVNELEYLYIDVIEKSLKALEIIKEKAVNVFILFLSDNLEDYNQYVTCSNLTQEEYDLLREMLNSK